MTANAIFRTQSVATCLAIVLLAAYPANPVHARSKAANWLVDQQIQEGCDGAKGRFSGGSVIERDLTGDGKPDLIIDHSGLQCGRSGSRSGFCGIKACSVLFYERQGDLLQLRNETLSIGVSVGKGKRPKIGLVGHNGKRGTVRWNGRQFR
ncbi:MAG: hypothetical protein H6888_10630 [Nitratireductor sp.]|nr:hypothetical protein [Nitratireductor sp.]MCC0021511.1 hypothetical protein [Nitratireductor sp.]